MAAEEGVCRCRIEFSPCSEGGWGGGSRSAGQTLGAGGDLRGTNLCAADLSGARLEGASFFKAVLDGADLAGAYLDGAQFLNCAQLIVTRNWQSAYRDETLACGAAVPDRVPSE